MDVMDSSPAGSVHEKAEAIREILARVEQSGLAEKSWIDTLRASWTAVAAPTDLQGWERLTDAERAQRSGQLDAILAGLSGVEHPPKRQAETWHIWLVALFGIITLTVLVTVLVGRWSQSVGTVAFAEVDRAKQATKARQVTRTAAEADAKQAAEAARKSEIALVTAEKKSLDAQKRFTAKSSDMALATLVQKTSEALRAAQTEHAGTETLKRRTAEALELAEKSHKAALKTSTELIDRELPTERDVLITVVLLGSIGGTIRLLASLSLYVGNRQLLRHWLLYYFVLPFIGGAIAVLVFLFIRTGMLSPANVDVESGAARLNLPVIYGFAGATGMFARNAIEKFGEIVELLFRTRTKAAKDGAVANSTTSKPVDVKATTAAASTPSKKGKTTQTKV